MHRSNDEMNAQKALLFEGDPHAKATTYPYTLPWYIMSRVFNFK